MSEYRDTMTDEIYNPEDLPVRVCMSGGGYYIGQLEPSGAPFSRLSGYYKTRKDAEKALVDGWPDRNAVENKELINKLIKSGKLIKNEGI